MIQITSALEPELLEQFIVLANEYVTWMIAEIQIHYPQLNIAEFASAHDYNDIRQKFPGDHVPPTGFLLVAEKDGEVAGCIALGKLTKQTCEMRTLFVRPAFRGAGIGRMLVESSLTKARSLHYDYVRLDTLGFMQGALSLYRSFGFYEIPPYHDVSHSLSQYIHFLELRL